MIPFTPEKGFRKSETFPPKVVGLLKDEFGSYVNVWHPVLTRCQQLEKGLRFPFKVFPNFGPS